MGNDDAANVGLALRRLVVSILYDPMLKVVLGAGVVTIIAYGLFQLTGESATMRPLLIIAGIYDTLCAILIVLIMLRRVRITLGEIMRP